MHNRNAILGFLFALFFSSCIGQGSKPGYNHDFEDLDSLQLPRGWILNWTSQNDGYLDQIDSVIVQHGKYSLKIAKVGTTDKNWGVCSYYVKPVNKGNKIKLTGFVKTENVKDGFAGLWMRIDGDTKLLAFDNMSARGITGTVDWKEYSIELPYDAEHAVGINVGALLSGIGKMWVDNLKVTVDGMPIQNFELKPLPKARLDTMFTRNGSEIGSITLNDTRINQLKKIGMFWGFLKYYHPAIARGDWNWDAELFRFLRKWNNTKESKDVYALMEDWLDSLGSPVVNVNEQLLQQNGGLNFATTEGAPEVKLKADFGDLFTEGNLPATLINKLAFIRDQKKVSQNNYYVGLSESDNPLFKNELRYSGNECPDAGTRLLALYRYWSVIQYYYPYRHLIGENWNNVLTDFIPRFVNAKDKKEYAFTCLELICHVHDTHASIWGNQSYDSIILGTLMIPIKAEFLQGKLMVTNYYTENLVVRNALNIGDIIEQIDGVPVSELVKKYLPYTSASNYNGQLRDLPSYYGFLLRGNADTATLLVSDKNGNKRSLSINRVSITQVVDGYKKNENEKQGYKLLKSGSIGYLYPARLKENDLAGVKTTFKNTKGLVIDLRCYPATPIIYSYGSWLKPFSSYFVSFTKCSMTKPGEIDFMKSFKNGGGDADNYGGKVIVLVNKETQSQAEFTTMALSTIPGVVVVGDSTAGADGNVSEIILPGGINTRISGLGVYYPDRTETQRVGVRINIPMKPTIKGIREGRDELLEKAMEIIENGAVEKK
jgi:C-terminal processing protease CtpA/Prc